MPILATALVVALCQTALADTPDDIVDLLGEPASTAQAQLQARGYVDAAGNNVWWNQKTGICVKVHLSQGRYQTIETTPSLDCGIKAFGESEGAAPREPSKAAIDACMNAADELQEEEVGTSIVSGKRHSGENWVLTMKTLGRTSHCTVTQSGDIIQMDPP